MNEVPELTIGQYLRRERERRNISLESVSLATRITLKNLEALENDDFQSFPAPLFVKGFLRSYALYIGVDPADLLSRYEARGEIHGNYPPLLVHPPAQETAAWKKYFLVLLLVILTGTTILAVLKKNAVPPPPVTLAPAERTRELSPPAKTPSEFSPFSEPWAMSKDDSPKDIGMEKGIPTTPPSNPDTMSGPQGFTEEDKEKRQVLTAKAVEKTWLRVQSDDQPQVEALLKPKETATWKAKHQFKVTVGNAGGVELSYNGVSQGYLGASGQVVHFIFPKETRATDPGNEFDPIQKERRW